MQNDRFRENSKIHSCLLCFELQLLMNDFCLNRYFRIDNFEKYWFGKVYFKKFAITKYRFRQNSSMQRCLLFHGLQFSMNDFCLNRYFVIANFLKYTFPNQYFS